MIRRKLLWHLYPSYLLIVFVPLVLITFYGAHESRRFYHAHVTRELTARARLVESCLSDRLKSATPAETDAFCKTLGKHASTRITVILPSGVVVGDSDEDPKRMDNHSDRPEVIDALAGRVRGSIRYSKTIQKDMMYLALPVYDGEKLSWVVRVSLPLADVDDVLSLTFHRLVLAGLGLALIAAAFSYLAARRISRPLETLKQGAERFAAGDLSFRLPVPGSAELGSLGESMNRMAALLDERVRTISAQRNEQDAVLSSMVEGVLAVDHDGRIRSLNFAAARLFRLDAEHAQGRSLPEVVRNADLQDFLARVLAEQKPIEDEITLHEQDPRHLQAHGAVLRDAQGASIGALVVLNDVTRLKKLEEVRRDFVANVSHELRTPITSIKGFVETLLEGALENVDEARRFLEIVARHADRLNAIIEDLLSLSRIEQEAEKGAVLLERKPLRGVLTSASQLCLQKAKEKDVRLEVECGDEVVAEINPTLLEQAVVNLVDNAIKYSKAGGIVSIAASAEGPEVAIRVRDWGSGIPREHLPRLFERFYRVDKARSRKLGGTGLGLAIAKHIVLAHNGRITVESKVGEGSTFTIRLHVV